MLQALLSLDQSYSTIANAPFFDHMAESQQFSGPTPVHVLPDGNYAPPVFMPGIPSQQSMLEAVDKLKFFLATAPGSFDQSPYDPNDPVAREERCLNRFQLPTGELISCVLWNGLYHVCVPTCWNFLFLGRVAYHLQNLMNVVCWGFHVTGFWNRHRSRTPLPVRRLWTASPER